MTVTPSMLDRLEQHWAVSALPAEDRSRARELAQKALLKAAVGSQIHIPDSLDPSDLSRIEQLALAYEIAALDGLEATLHPSSTVEGRSQRDILLSGSFRAYELRRVLPLAIQSEQLIFQVLHLAGLAYSGDQWTDLRRWLTDRAPEITPPSSAEAEWDRRLLFRIYECWLRLLQKKTWDDIDRVRSLIAGLREDQKSFEAKYLEGNGHHIQALAIRLIALYHWAKATELLCLYMLQGEPRGIGAQLDQHFESARNAASDAGDPALEVLLSWVHVASRKMVAGSVWGVAHSINSRVTAFVQKATRAAAMFELLPPQRAALQEMGLLDQASRAVVVELPTSGGKTLLAEFRILQALNQFDADKGWIAYVAPTRALVSQITRRLRRDFAPIGIRVEQLTAAVDIDSFEQELLNDEKDSSRFNVLVCTPEKLQLLIRNKAVTRPLVLVVLDEAQNLEDEERGLRVELLLATIKRDCPQSAFLLLMPYVPNASDLTNWLSPETGRTISVGTTAWHPNEKLVGIFDATRVSEAQKDWVLQFETVQSTPGSFSLHGRYQVGPRNPGGFRFSQVKSLSAKTVAMATVFSQRGTSIAVAGTIPQSWEMARRAAIALPEFDRVPEPVALVQRFLANEISPKFELIQMLNHGVGVHHAGLSDEVRSLIEWLAEDGHLKVICATTTIAQGINFPVSSVFLSTVNWPYGRKMPPRSFWNLAGRAGRFGQDSVGVIGLAAGDNPLAIKKYMSTATGDLISRLVTMLDDLEKVGRLGDLRLVIQDEQWTDFRNYIAHLWNEKKNLELVIAETEQLLRNTLGYTVLQSRKESKKASALLNATRNYAAGLAAHAENAALADSTGFSPEGVRSALLGLGTLDRNLTAEDWRPESLFGKGSVLPALIGIMLRIPEVKGPLAELSANGADRMKIARIANSWVLGESIEEIAEKHFGTGQIASAEELTKAITDACKGIYRALANAGTWGLSALSKMPTSGIDYNSITDDERRRLNSLPAMLYHGVRTEEAVLMRMNSVPRSASETLGSTFADHVDLSNRTSASARNFVRNLSSSDWQKAVPAGSAMSGNDYRQVWARLSGEPLQQQ